MKKEKLLKVVAGVIVSLFILILIMFLRDALYEKNMSIEYVKDTEYINMECYLKTTSADANELLKMLRQYDMFKDKLEDDEMYSDFVIYGDESYTSANLMNQKILYINNIIGNLNYYKDDIDTLLKQLNWHERRDVKFLIKKIKQDISQTNFWINEYNIDNDTSYSLIHQLSK